MIRKNRFCLASREKLLNFLAVRDCKVEGDLVLELQMLVTIMAFFFSSVPLADSAETARSKPSPENSQGQSRIRALSQVRVLGPEDDLAGIFLQVLV